MPLTDPSFHFLPDPPTAEPGEQDPQFDFSRPRDLWVVGDVHGAHDKLRALLIRAGLTDRGGNWTGGRAHLVFLGDYLDRGPDGIGVVRLVQQLERQARGRGGQVTALLGNHEVMFLAAALFQEQDQQQRLGFLSYWLSNGGQTWDLDRLTPEDLSWLQNRPLLSRAGNWLLAHADSLFYLGLGTSLEDVNQRGAELLRNREPGYWGAFANAFVDRLNFVREDGAAQVSKMLRLYGGQRLVHGHTPTYLLLHETTQPLPDDPTRPITYANHLCVAVDSGMAYFPDAGFIVRLGYPELGEEQILDTVALPPGLFGAVQPPASVLDLADYPL